MKLAVFHNLPSGGAMRLTRDFVRELRRRGHQLHEFGPSTADTSFTPLLPEVERRTMVPIRALTFSERRIPAVMPYVHAYQMRQSADRLDDVNRTIAARIDKERFDAVFAHDCQVLMNPYVLRHLATPSLYYCHHGHRERVKIVDGEPRAGSSALRRAKDWVRSGAHAWVDRKIQADQHVNLVSATAVATNSRHARDVLKHIHQREASVVYPGIDCSTFASSDAPCGDYVLCVGALIYAKGHRFLVEALGLIPEHRRPRLVIAANSQDPVELDTVTRLATHAGVSLSVESVRDDRRLADLYAGARAFVYAPMQEALGLAPLEAAACGAPVVAVAEGGVRETVLHDETGLLTARDPHAFAEQLQRLLSGDALRARLSLAGRAWIESVWTWDRAGDQIEQLLQQTAARQTVQSRAATLSGSGSRPVRSAPLAPEGTP